MLRSDVCYYSDPYIVVKGRIIVADTNDIFVHNAEDLDIVMLMYII